MTLRFYGGQLPISSRSACRSSGACDMDLRVCVAHGAFIPCRKDGEHRYTSNPYWVKAVRDYQTSPIENLTWEPAWPSTWV